jgi:class 3 adenylate cyclase
MLVLREYHTALGALVDKFEGTVERFSGDGLLVILTDLLPCPDPSIRAVQMALEMRDEVAKLRVKWSRSGHDIGFGIGIGSHALPLQQRFSPTLGRTLRRAAIVGAASPKCSARVPNARS